MWSKGWLSSVDSQAKGKVMLVLQDLRFHPSEQASIVVRLLRKLTRLAMAVCVLFAAQALHAQGNASVVGVVNDSSGAIVPGALVTITNEGTGLQQSATSDSGGRYNFPRLPIGNYAIGVVASGFKKVQQTGINLTAEQALTVNFTLEIGQVSEQVEVTGAVTGIETVTSR
jgi:hypothetical protein